jgi:transposase
MSELLMIYYKDIVMGKRNSCESASEQQAFWQMVIETWCSSGLSARAFCKREGLSEAAFYSWRAKLQPTSSDDAVVTVDDESEKPTFVELTPAPALSIEVVCSAVPVVRIVGSADRAILTEVLAAVRAASVC